MLNKPPYFPFYVDNFVSDPKVEAMETEEVGAYLLLLCKAWKEDPPGTIPNDDRTLCKWTRISRERWTEIKNRVLGPWRLQGDGRWHQKRMEHEWDAMMLRRARRAQSGRVAMRKRWGNEKSSRVLITSSQTTLNLWNRMLNFFSCACLGCGSLEEVMPALINPEGNNNVENVQPLCQECIESNKFLKRDLRVGQVDDPGLIKRWSITPKEKVKKDRTIKFNEQKFALTDNMKFWIDGKYPEFVQGDVEYMVGKFCRIFTGKTAVSWMKTFYTFVDNEVIRYKYRPGDWNWRDKNGGPANGGPPQAQQSHDKLREKDQRELEEFEREVAAAGEGEGDAGKDTEDFFLVEEDEPGGS